MDNFLLLIIIYLSYLIIWLILNLVFYFISIIFRNSKPSNFIASLGLVVIYLLNFAIGLGMLWFGILLLLDRKILWLIIYIFIGAGLLSRLFSFFQLPFIFITAYFLEKIESSNFNKKNKKTILLEEEVNIIDVIDDDEILLKKMAIYFIALYTLSLLDVLSFSIRDGLGGWGYYIINPFSNLVFLSLLLGIPYGIYNKIINKPFFTKNKKDFFISIWRASLFMYLGFILMRILI